MAELRRPGGDAAIFVNGKPLAGYAYWAPEPGCQLSPRGGPGRNPLYADWVGLPHDGDSRGSPIATTIVSSITCLATVLADADPEVRFSAHQRDRAHDGGRRGASLRRCASLPTEQRADVVRLELWAPRDRRGSAPVDRLSPRASMPTGYMFYNGYTAEWQMWGTWQSSRRLQPAGLAGVPRFSRQTLPDRCRASGRMPRSAGDAGYRRDARLGEAAAGRPASPS